MKCDREPEAAGRYVSGEMSEAERLSFEEHYFACDPCFRMVQALQDAQVLLKEDLHAIAPARRAFPVAWVAMAATVTVGVILWRMPAQQPVVDQPPSVTADRGQAAPAQAPSTAPAPPSPAPAPAAAPAENPLDRLAVVAPPQYVALTTRSEADATAVAFADAMKHYTAGRFAQAARALGAIAGPAPDLPHVQFFLGVSELMSGRTAPAAAALRRAADSGVSPYADEAHFYLAKAALRDGDVPLARKELQAAVARDAGPEGEAARLLGELKRISR